MRSSVNLVRILLALTAAVTVVSSAREGASAPRHMLRRSTDDDDHVGAEESDVDAMSDIGKWVRAFVKLERRVVEEEAERLESMVERIEEQQAKEADLLDRVASDSVVKTYLDKVDVRIGQLMSKLPRKHDVDEEEEVRQARDVETESASDDDEDNGDSDVSLMNYLDKVDVRIGQLVSKLSRKKDVEEEEVWSFFCVGLCSIKRNHDVDEEEEFRQARDVKTESASGDEDNGDVSLKKFPEEDAFEHDLLQRLDSLFRNVLTKQFGRKLAKAFFKHIFPLVAEELQKVEERRMRWEKKRKGSKQTIEDRRDTFSEFVARPATSGGAEFRARPSFASSSGAEFSARAASAAGTTGSEFRARSKHEQYGGVGGGADSLDDWIDLLRAFLF